MTMLTEQLRPTQISEPQRTGRSGYVVAHAVQAPYTPYFMLEQGASFVIKIVTGDSLDSRVLDELMAKKLPKGSLYTARQIQPTEPNDSLAYQITTYKPNS